LTTNPILGIDITWRNEYQTNRYLRKASKVQLAHRLFDLKSNLWSTDQDGEVTQLRFSENRSLILRLICHVLLEIAEREGSPIINFDEKAFREEATSSYVPPSLKSAILGDRGIFTKFGNRDHLFETYKSGKIRIAPAANYNDSSLNSAQQDDELNHWTRTPNEQLVFELIDSDENPIPVKIGEFQQGKTIPNYLVWCCAYGYETRLFKDFESNAALIIRNEKEFIDRLTKAANRTIPGFTFQLGPVRYYDQYNPPSEGIKLPFMKSMKYLYQNEYRFTWQSDNPLKINSTFLELGSLEDISEFCELK
jgi:hypothetical protein